MHVSQTEKRETERTVAHLKASERLLYSSCAIPELCTRSSRRVFRGNGGQEEAAPAEEVFSAAVPCWAEREGEHQAAVELH